MSKMFTIMPPMFHWITGSRYHLSFLIACCLALAGRAQRENPIVPTWKGTFHCVSLYWSPTQGAAGRVVKVKYKRTTESTYSWGYPMVFNDVSDANSPGYNHQKGKYRGSVVNLLPNTAYHVILELWSAPTGGSLLTTSNGGQPIEVRTMNETFTLGTIVKCTTATGNITTPITISSTSGYGGQTGGGSINGSTGIITYKVYDGLRSNGAKQVIDISKNGPGTGAIMVNSPYVILRNFKIIGAPRHGVDLNAGNVVVENCDIINWGRQSNLSPGNPAWGWNHDAAIFCDNSGLGGFIIQRNLLHDPTYSTNTWSQEHGVNGDGQPDKHPKGPSAVDFNANSTGGNIVRYNECYITPGVNKKFNDILGGGNGGSGQGTPGADSDIYGNYLANCYDDAVMTEGGGQNVRFFLNYIEDVHVAIANAAVTVGPIYWFRNVIGRRTLYGVKMGASSGDLAIAAQQMKGMQYLFNNTFLKSHPDNGATGGLGTYGTNGRPMRYFVSYNNILEASPNAPSSEFNISPSPTQLPHINATCDYDLYSNSVPFGEGNGVQGRPTFVLGSLNWGTKTANYKLLSTSKGIDVGKVLENFTDGYSNAGPDIGAHEKNYPDVVYGDSADFVPGEVMRTVGGKPSKGETVSSVADKAQRLAIRAFPNPAHGQVTILASSLVAEMATLQVLNTAGAVVKSLHYSLMVGTNRNELAIGNLPPGIYLLHLRQATDIAITRLVIE